MIIGTLADRQISPHILLRVLCISTSILVTLTFYAIANHWHSSLIFSIFQLQQLASTPVWGLATMIVLSNISHPDRQFGTIRVWGTFGWIAACLTISHLLHADNSTASGFASAIVWLLVAFLTYAIPSIPPQNSHQPLTWKERFGLETFQILKNPTHRAVFLTSCFLSIPLAAFYPYTRLHLEDLHVSSVSSFMALGQVTEVVAMYTLAPLLSRYKLRSLFLIAIGACILRYLLFASSSLTLLCIGIALHGICFSLFFIPGQIYVEQSIDKSIRFRAQSLMTLLVSGIGNFCGYLSCGWLRSLFTQENHTTWPLYWLSLTLCVGVVGVYFWKACPSTPSASE